MTIDQIKIDKVNSEFPSLSAEERVMWAWESFGSSLILSTSFGLQSGVMLDLVLKVNSEIPVIFIDTGYLFQRLMTMQCLQEKLGFRGNVYSAKMSSAYQEKSFGKLWEQGKDGMKEYNFINKKSPWKEHFLI